MKYEYGDYISLCWEGTPDALFIKGHVPFDEAIEKLRQWGDDPRFVLGAPVHEYARWSLDAASEYTHNLRNYSVPGRGRFPVTMIPVIRERTLDEITAFELLGEEECNTTNGEHWVDNIRYAAMAKPHLLMSRIIHLADVLQKRFKRMKK